MYGDEQLSVVIGFKKLNELATRPEYANPGDAGMDLTSVENKTIPAHGRALVKTGISLELPPAFEAQIRPRSGLALKHGVTVLNSPGTIDSGYRGEIGVILYNTSDVPFEVEVGMRIAQMVIARVEQAYPLEMEELDETERGEGGFGSTGNR